MLDKQVIKAVKGTDAFYQIDKCVTMYEEGLHETKPTAYILELAGAYIREFGSTGVIEHLKYHITKPSFKTTPLGVMVMQDIVNVITKKEICYFEKYFIDLKIPAKRHTSIKLNYPETYSISCSTTDALLDILEVGGAELAIGLIAAYCMHVEKNDSY